LRALAQSLNAAVEFCGFVSDDELSSYYGRARALLFPGVEDFGIVPVEALAAGCPVIALREGGVVDSLTPSSATFYTDSSPEGLAAAILRFENTHFEEHALRLRADEFSRDKFITRFRLVLVETLSEYGISADAGALMPVTAALGAGCDQR
jgi:glycosyltransferase involved in cell wall biosynthesis